MIKSISDKGTHIHYTRINTNVYIGGYELYRLNILSKRNPTQQYKLLADFLRIALFNRSNYENFLPSCPIIYSMSSVDHPEDWRGMLFGTIKYPSKNMPYPYICYLSVMPNDRRHKLGSILLNQFINEMVNKFD
jgi:ribosomal protein S18 acetylase RimI-like enzyme